MIRGLAAVVVLGACGPEPTPRERFEAEVVPALERSCASTTCHGYDPGRSDEVIDPALFLLAVQGGRLADVDAAYEAALRIINTVEDPGHSTLLRKPLAMSWGGLPHAGGDNLRSPTDADYLAIAAWIDAEPAGGEDPLPLDEGEALFAEQVRPALVAMGCGGGNCHGPRSPVPFRLQPGLAGEPSTAEVKADYAAALTMLSMDGDPGQSRLLRKALPLHDGGHRHKGGNVSFLSGPDDPRAEAVRAWACFERERRLGAACLQPGEAPISGFVAVRGPVRPEDPFDADVFNPGTTLVWVPVSGPDLVPGLPEPLTDDVGVDVRDPAVDPEGRRVAFTLRRSEAEGHQVMVLDLESRALRAITDEPGASWREPTWGADGQLWAVSDRAGVVADGGLLLDTDLYTLDPDSGAVTRRSWTPHAERKPVFLVSGTEAGGEVAFTALREAITGQARAHPFRFPPGLHTEYHQHFGVTATEDLVTDLRELPDGRYVVVLGDRANAWVGGRLGLLDRNFGPEVTAGITAPPALPGYLPPLARLDPDAASAGVTETLYRDPAPLPDGRLLVATSTGPVDLADPDAAPRLRIELVSPDEAPGADAVALGERVVLLEDPETSLYDPEPVVRRAAARLEPEARREGVTTTRLNHQGLPMIDALLARLPPAGERPVRDDIVGVRLVEAIPLGPEAWFPVPADQTTFAVTGATSAGLGGLHPARVLAELPLADDDTFQVELPGELAFRVQALDADGRFTGTAHNRWFDTTPGQVIPQGVPVSDISRAYDSTCAGCHGANDGDPDHVFVEPDVLTTASLTLSRYADGDPRRPLAPPLAGDDTRREVDFRRDVQPLLDRSCAGCHGGGAPAAGLSLEDRPTPWFNVAYEHLLQPGAGSGGGYRYVDAAVGSARGSLLMEWLTAQELDAPGAAPRSPHAGSPALDADEVALVARWIDLGATWIGRAP